MRNEHPSNKISGRFNRFYHVLLGKIVEINKELVIEADDKLYSFYPDNKDKTKAIFKAYNEDYPRDKDLYPIHTMELTTSELLDHLEYIIDVLNKNDYCLSILEKDAAH